MSLVCENVKHILWQRRIVRRLFTYNMYILGKSIEYGGFRLRKARNQYALSSKISGRGFFFAGGFILPVSKTGVVLIRERKAVFACLWNPFMGFIIRVQTRVRNEFLSE